LSEKEGLSESAYRPLNQGETYQPYVPASETLTEFTVRTMIAGALFGVLFGAANAYLGLKSGLTISTSIPVAVLTVAFFKALSAAGAHTSILEANISQTIGSASSSVASGVIFTLPALFLWGLDPSLAQMTLLAMCGGLLGVLFMIPLRRLLIQGEHGNLPYPEGTACAEVLVASDVGGSRATPVFMGLLVGALLKWLTSLAHVIPEDVHVRIPFIRRAQVGSEVSAALFGVGYILGPRIATVMVGGGLLSALVIIPAIAYWGQSRAIPLYPETVKTIAEMSSSEIWTRYVRYIGAGAVAAGGLMTLIKSIPTMLQSFRVGTRELRQRFDDLSQMGPQRAGEGAAEAAPRTDRDLPLRVVGIGALIIFLALAFIPMIFGPLAGFVVRIAAALLVVIFAFFFVTVSSRIVGLVGVTSNPTSGMTIASLLGTSGVFYLMGWTDDMGKAAAITVGCVVAIAASIAGDTSQDLKTGFLLGATPRKQQIGEIIGVLTCAVFVCLTIILLNASYGFGTQELAAPQATLMKLVIEGVLDASLPWGLVGIGIVLAVIAELLKIPSLPFAVGVYLPVATMVPVFFGGLLRMYMERTSRSEEEKTDRREKGVLLGSGLVGGTGLFGVVIAAVAFYRVQTGGDPPVGWGTSWAGPLEPLLGYAALALMILWFAYSVRKSD
jgi:putative OPT family oligopeptide transporter